MCLSGQGGGPSLDRTGAVKLPTQAWSPEGSSGLAPNESRASGLAWGEGPGGGLEGALRPGPRASGSADRGLTGTGPVCAHMPHPRARTQALGSPPGSRSEPNLQPVCLTVSTPKRGSSPPPDEAALREATGAQSRTSAHYNLPLGHVHSEKQLGTDFAPVLFQGLVKDVSE